jgi:O-methyltransferase
MVEAGCFNGGSSAKFSIACSLLGYDLHVYDSFAGVEPGDHDFSGQYAASEGLVRQNITNYGEIGICSFHKGWFSDTLAKGCPYSVGIAYIDCDIAKGTREALEGIVPALAQDGWIFSQDFHIGPVRNMLCDSFTLDALGIPTEVIQLSEQLACFHSAPTVHARPFQ